MRALRLGMIVGPAVLLAALGVTHPLEWAARVAVYGYAACYTALDLLAGVAAGTLVRRFSGQGVTAQTPQVQAMFQVGNDLGDIGSWCFLLGCVLAVRSIDHRIPHGGRRR